MAAAMRMPGSLGTLVYMATAATPFLAFMLSLFAVWFLYEHQPVCPRCSGRGGHRSDCPNEESPS